MLKNKTWIYADERKAEVFLHMGNGKYFDKLRTYDRKILTKEDEKITVQITRYIREPKYISVVCWYWKKRSEAENNFFYGSLLFDIVLPFVKDGVYNLSCDLPKTEKWCPVQRSNTLIEDAKSSEANAQYYQNFKGWVYSPAQHKKEDELVILHIDEYMTKKEARTTWKTIKKNNYVSPFFWDNWMHEYDCYCKFCSVLSTDGPRQNWKSWVGNPEVGYVYKLDNNPLPGSYLYKGKYYTPCPANKYNRLTFFNKEEYEKEIADKSGDYETFDKLWSIELTHKEIEENGNIVGGAWRHLSNETIMAKENIHPLEEKDYEKVVTLGWHRTNIKGSVRCPVCDDLYNIICRSEYNPVPFFKKLRERVIWKWERISVKVSNIKYDIWRFFNHGKKGKSRIRNFDLDR